jgi:hypothetical protein
VAALPQASAHVLPVRAALAAFEACSGRQAGPDDLPQLKQQAQALEAAEGARPGLMQLELLEDLVGLPGWLSLERCGADG